MNNEKYLVVVSGPSGSGKDTVVKRLMELHPEIEISVSATTRPMRPGEREGVDYYYLARDEFERRIAAGEILEYAQYCENYYGTPRAAVDRRIAAHKTVILVIEVVGAANIKRNYPGATTVFVRPPSYEELEQRLRGRGTEFEAAIQSRLRRAQAELEYAEDFDVGVVTALVDECADAIYALIHKHQRQYNKGGVAFVGYGTGSSERRHVPL